MADQVPKPEPQSVGASPAPAANEASPEGAPAQQSQPAAPLDPAPKDVSMPDAPSDQIAVRLPAQSQRPFCAPLGCCPLLLGLSSYRSILANRKMQSPAPAASAPSPAPARAATSAQGSRAASLHPDSAPTFPAEAVPHGDPTRQYLNTKVTGVLLEGMKKLAKDR